MDNQKKNGPTPGGIRERLAEKLPLSAPFMIQIFPVYACNLKCAYCIHAVEPKKRSFISEKPFMDFDVYKKLIDGMKQFSKPIKMLRFAGMGEPLLHRNLAKMIQYAKQNNVAESIDIVTNATLLTHELTDELIDAGLSRLRVSLEGLSGEDYQKHAGVWVDVPNLIENLNYFFHKRKDTKVYIKIIDYMLKNQAEYDLFERTYSPIADSIAVEHLTPTVAEIDYTQVAGEMDFSKQQNGSGLLAAAICPQPFYMLQVNPDGNIVPCCSTEYPVVVGNLNMCGIDELWNGRKANQFRRQCLDGAANVCAHCSLYQYGLYEEDILDASADRLKKQFDQMIKQGGSME